MLLPEHFFSSSSSKRFFKSESKMTAGVLRREETTNKMSIFPSDYPRERYSIAIAITGEKPWVRQRREILVVGDGGGRRENGKWR